MHGVPPFRTFKHCPRCGQKLGWRADTRGEPKRQTCASCHYKVYHNPVAATEAYCIRSGRLLLLRRTRQPRAGYWDIPGGFLEVGEEPLPGLRREIREELHASLIRPRLFGAYASGYWFQKELTSVVVLTYTAELRGRIKLNYENSEAGWVPLRKAHGLAFLHQRRALRDLSRLSKD